MGFCSSRIFPAAGGGGSDGRFFSPPDYAQFLSDGTMKLNGKARTWDDLRVAAHELQQVGANPPEWQIFSANGATTTDFSLSPPARGAWIETLVAWWNGRRKRRPPHGGRGLKQIDAFGSMEEFTKWA